MQAELGLKTMKEVIAQFTKGEDAVRFPNTASVLQIAAICPLPNATVERFFSKLRQVR